jgi:hypothetical protein
MAQLADRVAEPVPDGIELYLAAEDLLSDQVALADLINAIKPDPGFQIVVEGPLRSLDGLFFDVTRNNEANREVVRRLVTLGRRVGARSALIHAIAVRDQVDDLRHSDRRQALQAALPLIGYFASVCADAGLKPTIENVPPVCMMREGQTNFSLIGVEPSDLLFLCGQIPDLGVTVDVSHVQLYINATHTLPEAVDIKIKPLVQIWNSLRTVDDWKEYVDEMDGHIHGAHLSNARGVTGEGLPCYDGELDLAKVGRYLAGKTSFLVTETIEPDPDHSIYMREVQRCLKQALAA